MYTVIVGIIDFKERFDNILLRKRSSPKIVATT